MVRSGLLAAFGVCSLALSQTASAPTPEPPTIFITVDLVQIDAVATDSKGKPVTDLRADEVEVRENGRVRKVTAFSLTRSGRTERPEAQPPGRRAGVPLPMEMLGDALKRSEVKRTIALIVDDIGMSFDSMEPVRRGLRSFINNQMEPGDLVAVIRTGAGASALQQFTSNKRLLLAAVEQVKFSWVGRSGFDAMAPVQDMLPALQDPAVGGIAMDDRHQRELEHNYFVVGTLGAIEYVVNGMKEMPGRKSAIVFSDGIPVRDKERNPARTLDSLRRLADRANRAGVAVYTVDSRGVMPLGLSAADNVRSGASSTPVNMASHLAKLIEVRRSRFFDSQNGLRFLAVETGGLFLRNDNDLAALVAVAAEDQRAYYLIGYKPDIADVSVSDFGGKSKAVSRSYQRIEIRSLRPGVTIRHRRGYYGAPDVEPYVPIGNQQKILAALRSPFTAIGIPLTVTCWYDHNPKRGGVVHTMLHIDASKLQFLPEGDGAYRVAFDLATSTFGENGKLSELAHRTVTLKVREDRVDLLKRLGLLYTVFHPVKKPGVFMFRAAVIDDGSGVVGSGNQFIEVPDVSKRRLALSGVLVASSSYSQDYPQAGDEELAEDYSLGHPAVRRFLPGQEISYGFRVINPSGADSRSGLQLETMTRILNGGRQIFSTGFSPVQGASDEASKTVQVGGSLRLTQAFAPGDYILQVAVRDRLAKDAKNVVTQYMDFHVVGPEGSPANASARE